jgi:hypothetical protein
MLPTEQIFDWLNYDIYTFSTALLKFVLKQPRISRNSSIYKKALELKFYEDRWINSLKKKLKELKITEDDVAYLIKKEIIFRFRQIILNEKLIKNKLSWCYIKLLFQKFYPLFNITDKINAVISSKYINDNQFNKNKYLKYKTKYLNLKENITSNVID